MHRLWACARQPYEFGVKASIAISATGNLIVGARSFPGNPYDGHTLAEQLEQTRILTDHAPQGNDHRSGLSWP